ncbi:Immunity protein CdiI-o11 [Klebsiella spallanzanii]|uniref:Immunity protein CdiI-o11 n=2 Tax=Klebsiella spallanzanii TaxID=2587528 RepID=A0ABY6V6H8_9ENTR|nr:contact-dependent growth inhibition system immunity protein [Klebsiella spallanzanii]VUS21854.1 Immunity protein CdiI-o11 [Klebsiella spallanzanii]
MKNIHLTQGDNASVSFNGDLYSIVTLSGCRILINDYESYCSILNADSSDFDLGSAVCVALDNSKIVNPEENCFFDRDIVGIHYKKWVANIMQKYSYKTKKVMFKKMNLCNIRRVNGVITIEPMCHDKLESWSGDRISESDYVIIPDTVSYEDVGAALRLAFARCKSRV